MLICSHTNMNDKDFVSNDVIERNLVFWVETAICKDEIDISIDGYLQYFTWNTY